MGFANFSCDIRPLENRVPHLTHDPIDASQWPGQAPDAQTGAVVEFAGIVRCHDADTRVDALYYEAYEPMAERLIAQSIEQAHTRWSLRQVSVMHRLGVVLAGELAVLIRVYASHRDQAFEGCRFLIEAIKHDVPIWKRERSNDGTTQSNSSRRTGASPALELNKFSEGKGLC